MQSTKQSVGIIVTGLSHFDNPVFLLRSRSRHENMSNRILITCPHYADICLFTVDRKRICGIILFTVSQKMTHDL